MAAGWDKLVTHKFSPQDPTTHSNDCDRDAMESQTAKRSASTINHYLRRHAHSALTTTRNPKMVPSSDNRAILMPVSDLSFKFERELSLPTEPTALELKILTKYLAWVFDSENDVNGTGHEGPSLCRCCTRRRSLEIFMWLHTDEKDTVFG